MHLRRALLVFAVVLGLAALVAAVTRPRDPAEPERDTSAPAKPEGAAPSSRRGPVRLAFRAGERPRTRRVETGRPATVTVEVKVPGQVELQGFGVTEPAAPATPARFDLLPDERGVYPVVFIPAASGVRTRVGRLVVTRARAGTRRRG